MGWFKRKPMELEYGEPIHQMVARAVMQGGIVVDSDLFGDITWNFVGPHGIAYSGGKMRARYDSAAQGVAQICENIQRDFNERIAGIDAARKHAIDKGSVAPLFVSAHTDEA